MPGEAEYTLKFKIVVLTGNNIVIITEVLESSVVDLRKALRVTSFLSNKICRNHL
jgi:hypothetical protein